MASSRVGSVHEIRRLVAGGLTEMVKRLAIPEFREIVGGPVVKPVDYDDNSKRWVLSTNIPWIDTAKPLQYPHPVFDYSSGPELERNTGNEFHFKTLYGQLRNHCEEQFFNLKTEGVNTADNDVLFSLAESLSSSSLLYVVEGSQKKSIIRIEQPYVSLDEMYEQFQTADTFVLTQLLMSRLEVKSGELSASSRGYTEIGIEFYEPHYQHLE